MNKFFGFYELKSMSLPTVPWEEFKSDTDLDKGLLWTVRVAVEGSNDLNLPRLIGATADEARSKGRELLEKYSERGLVIYYPYFIAEKSGVLEVGLEHVVIEAVDKDLWNLVTHGKKDITIIINTQPENKNIEFHGNQTFLDANEIEELKNHVAAVKGRFRDELCEGKSIFAEWSFAYNTDAANKPIGCRYLVFYELRTVR